MNLKGVQHISIPVIVDERGSVSFIEGEKDIPFAIARVFYIFGVQEMASRGGHAHKNTEQFLIAINGSFEVTLDNGYLQETFFCNNRLNGLYIPPMIWNNLNNFTSDAVCLVLASTPYDNSEYLRNYQEWLELVRKKVTS